ncbi:cellulose biosynthesis protein BcsQ [Novosphingobium chloroacetimidivorans]|uniref:Cellulose biosynthesis protein BcsQ n=1 Tax=Novosphingobium chloroacetimidivorans TaxID=1428314 RepID=A0A7W7K912_9SPHN|nr:ParA family protein [Novosphingobium chloroacetimidivorans]MBB4858151.1 cellulose biosynthesis protein BcsQ [Novosphingobium chloroacetimidivorans]
MSGSRPPAPRGAEVSAAAPSGHSGTTATIAIYSVKGGVGKTTIAANLAWCSAELSGRSTLLWDLDAAGGSGFLYGLEPHRSRAAGEVFAREGHAEKLIRRTAFDGLDVLPADESIRTLDATLSALGKRKRLAKLAETLGQRYERIVLDCPPVMNELSAQVVRAADLIIVPLPPSPLSARALELVVREVADHAKRHPPILPVLSMLDMRRTLHKAAREENPAWPVIPYASAVEQCAVQQRPVGAIAPQSPSAQRFIGLWRAIERKLAER